MKKTNQLNNTKKNTQTGWRRYLGMAVIGSLTLGLAPFTPHPHIWKQLKNLWYGRDMPALDWFDLFMHGAPWVFLIVVLVQIARGK